MTGSRGGNATECSRAEPLPETQGGPMNAPDTAPGPLVLAETRDGVAR